MPNEMDTASFGGDVEPILPDGWDGVSDIFADAEVVNDPIDGADEFRDDLGLEDLLNEGNNKDEAAAENEAPTTGDEPTVETAPSAGPRTLKLKVNHQEREVDLNAMSDEDLVALFQKGYAFDEMKAREKRDTYQRVYQEELDLGMSERQARLAAEHEAGGDFREPEESPAPEVRSESVPTGRDIAEELKQLRLVRPSMKAIPDEVTRMITNGVNATQAYLAWESDVTRKTAASLKRENEVLKQNAASAARAPVTGVSGGGSTTGKAQTQFERDFLKGFEDGVSW